MAYTHGNYPRPKMTADFCPTNEYTADQLEFMFAMQRFKQETGRRFPSWSEVLAVLVSLGYRKTERRV